MRTFRSNPYPSKDEKIKLAMSLNISQEMISNWFGHRRRKNENKRVLSGSE